MHFQKLITTGVIILLLAPGCSDNGDSPVDSQVGTSPTISVADLTVIEGQPAGFTVSLSKAGTQAITFSYATADGSADSSDFTAAAGTGTIAIGQTSTTVTVNTKDDSEIDSTETFSLILSGASVKFTGNDSVAVATIQDNDATPVIQVNDLTVVEGASANFVFTLSKVMATPVNIYFHTMDGTAADGQDYTGQSGTETIAAGLTSVIQSVTTLDDNEIDSTETFMMLIDSATVEVVDSIGVCTITNNDVSYATDIRPILNSAGCAVSGCHGTGSGGLTLSNTSYSVVRNASGNNGAIVVPGNANSSNLYRKTTPAPPFGGRMPQGGPFLSTAQQNLIRDWINQGANDN